MVVDEPFYAYYLAETGLDHPGRDLVLESQPTDAQAVAKALTAALPAGKSVQYQKHMSHHILPDTPTGWIDGVVNCFLLRDPRAMIASYVKSRPDVTLDDLGLPQLLRLFEETSERTGKAPVVIDSDDLLVAPEAMLRALCGRVGISFESDMLAWPAGPRETDGVWAPWWYASVEKSTGFEPRPRTAPALPQELAPLAAAAMPYYEQLAQHKLRL